MPLPSTTTLPRGPDRGAALARTLARRAQQPWRVASRRPAASPRATLTVLVASAVLVSILVIDWLVWPGRDLDLLYAIPVLITALYVAPRQVAVIAAVAVVTDATGAVIARDSTASWAVTLPSLIVVCLFGIALAQQRRQISEHAARADQARAELQQFLSMVAHDLAGPVTALTTYGEVLRQPNLEPSLYARVGTGIGEVVEQTDRFVEDRRDAARLGRGSFALKRQPTDLVLLAREVVQRQGRAGQRPVVLVDPPSALPGHWDPTRIGQVLGNLVTNAVTYADRGEVQVSLERTDTEAICHVADHGPGIPPAEGAHIFEPFVRLDRSHPGTGLGLYLARGIVTAHGGRIWLASEPGAGSTFSFALPLASTT
jgi:signal transduction histidine kinase